MFITPEATRAPRPGDAPAGDVPRKPTKQGKKSRPFWQELIVLCVIAVVLAGVIKAFFIQSFYVPSESMMPTLVGHSVGSGPDDRIIVQKISYWTGDVERGDVVVFKDPGGWLPSEEEPDLNVLQRGMELIGLYPSGGHLVKRVIGVGGDKISYCEDVTRVKVNGTLVDEPYVRAGKARVPAENKQGCRTVEVPDGHLWLMGDNRGNSEDSRAHVDDPDKGFLDTGEVVGKVWSVVWPKDRFGGLGDTGTITSSDLDPK